MPAGILDLIANSLAMKKQRQQEKDAEAMSGVRQALSAWSSPSAQNDQQNAIQDLDYYLGELVGPGYKEHQPFILNALHGLGNAILGGMGAQLPQKRLPQIPIAPGQPAPLTRRDGTAVGQQQPPQQQPATPSSLAPGGPGVSAQTLATGQQPQTIMGQPVSATGVPVGRQPGAPVLMPISAEAARGARIADLMAQGKLGGKEAQEAEQHLQTLMQAQRRGEMTLDEVKENMKQFLSAQLTTGMGTESNTYIRFPADGDKPTHTEIFQRNTRTGALSQHGKPVSWDEITRRGGTETTKPTVDRTVWSNVSGRNKQVQDYFQQNPAAGPPPGPRDIVRIGQRISGEGGPPEIIQAMLMPAPAGADRTQLAQLQKAAKARYGRVGPDGKLQPISDEEAEQIGSDMYINFQNLKTAREQQQMGLTEFQSGISPGLGIESISLPPGVRRIAPGAPLTFDQVQAMGQEPSAGAPALLPPQAAPTAPQQPAPAAPPTGAQPPAAGFPSARPGPTSPPAQPGAAAPAQTSPQTFSPLGVPGVAPQAQQQNAVNEYLAKINGLGGYNQAGAMQGALVLQQKFGLTSGQLDEAAAEYTGNKKAIQANQEQSAGMLRFVDAIDQFSDQFLNAARQVPDAGSLFANTVQRDFLSKFYSNPKLASMKAAGLALDRVWSAITSNAYQSRAQLPQGALKATMDSINDKMTFPEMLAVVKRIKTESATERWTFAKQEWDIKRKQEANPIGQATGFRAGPAPAMPREMTGKPADGTARQVRAKGSNEVVTFYYDAEKDQWTRTQPRRQQ